MSTATPSDMPKHPTQRLVSGRYAALSRKWNRGEWMDLVTAPK